MVLESGVCHSQPPYQLQKERHPDWWKRYQDFTAGQLGELLSGRYGRLDILWLDGGWIKGDDIGLDSILRGFAPGGIPDSYR